MSTQSQGWGSWLSSWFVSTDTSYYSRRRRAINSLSNTSTVEQQWNDVVDPWFDKPWKVGPGTLERDQIITFLLKTLDLSEDGKAESEELGKRTAMDCMQWSLIHEPDSNSEYLTMFQWLCQFCEQGIAKLEEDVKNIPLNDTKPNGQDEQWVNAVKLLLFESVENKDSTKFLVHWLTGIPMIENHSPQQRSSRLKQVFKLTQRLLTALHASEGLSSRSIAEMTLGMNQSKDVTGWTLLHTAYHSPILMETVLEQCHEIGKEDGDEYGLVKALINSGFNGNQGARPLDIICWHGELPSLKLLLKWMEKSENALTLSQTKPHRYSCLHYLALGVDTGIQDESIERGSRVECLNALVNLLIQDEACLKEEMIRGVPLPISGMDVFGSTENLELPKVNLITLAACVGANPELVASLLSLASRLGDDVVKEIVDPSKPLLKPVDAAKITLETIKKRGGGRKREEGVRACQTILQSLNHEMK